MSELQTGTAKRKFKEVRQYIDTAFDALEAIEKINEQLDKWNGKSHKEMIDCAYNHLDDIENILIGLNLA